ncbi:MAG: hypothetical protein IH585_15845 [Anaerolineaceae bacterium]|nr:hypothetical protein [Anaerolineaceae bacterium]
MANVNLEALKKNIYQAYFSDGVWDIILGLIYLSFGLGVLINQNFWYLFPIIVTLPLALKRSVSDPRIGSLKFKKSQRMWLMVLYFLFNILVLGFIVFLGIINPSGDNIVRWLTVNIFLVIGLIIAIILCLVGWFVKFQRLYLYAAFNLIGFASVGRVAPVGVVLAILGVVFLLSGMIVMRNFMKRNPKIMLPEESGEGTE